MFIRDAPTTLGTAQKINAVLFDGRVLSLMRGHGEHPAGEVRSLGAGVERAHATLVGRVGGASPRAWRHGRGGPGHGPVADSDRSRPAGTAVGHPVGPRPCASAGRRPQAAHRHRRDAAVGPQCPARTGHRRGAGRQPLAMDVEERLQVGGRVAGPGPFGESWPRQRTVARARLHAAGESQDERRHPTPGPGRPVSLSQRPGPKGPGSRPAGDFGGHQRRRSWSATSRTGGGPGVRRAIRSS